LYTQLGHTVQRISPLPPPGKAVGQRRPITSQQFAKFGVPSADNKYDLTIHARNRPTLFAFEGHNYPLEKWNEVLAMLRALGYERIAAIGTKAQALAPEGTEDLRGIDLGSVMNVMASSRLVIGPSSGPMHLASLCKVPHVVWARDRHQSAVQTRNKERYEDYWNPHRTKVRVISHGDKEVVDANAIVEAVKALDNRPVVVPVSPTPPNHGVVFVAVGPAYVQSAGMCIDSLRHVYGGPIMLVVNHRTRHSDSLAQKFGVTVVSHPTSLEDNRLNSRVLKTQIMQICPYETALFIDADALVLDSIDELWHSLPDDSDIALTMSQFFPRVGDGRKAKNHMGTKMYVDDLNYTIEVTGPQFPHYSSSTMLWHRNERTLELSRIWFEEWQRFKGCDMFPLARALNTVKPKITKLHRKYNLRYHMTGDTVIYTAQVRDLKKVHSRLFPPTTPDGRLVKPHAATLSTLVRPPAPPVKRIVRSVSRTNEKFTPRRGAKTLRELLAERANARRPS